MSTRHKYQYFLLIALFVIPIAVDIFDYRELIIFFGCEKIPDELIAQKSTLSPPHFIGIFEFVELVIIFCYITIIQSNIIRLIFIIFTIVFCIFGFVISSLANILIKSLLYQDVYFESIEKMCIVAAYSYLASLLFVFFSNILFRRISFSHALSLVLIVAGSIGIIFTRFRIIEDPRYLQFSYLYGDCRFSMSELYYFIGLEVAAFSLINKLFITRLDIVFNNKMQLLNKQYKIADYYYRYVCTKNIEHVSPVWESMLLGCKLDIIRVGRHYYGVPTPNTIKSKINYTTQCQSICHVLPQIFGILFALCVLL